MRKILATLTKESQVCLINVISILEKHVEAFLKSICNLYDS